MPARADVPEELRWDPSAGGSIPAALEGLTVLELSQFIAGPVCGCILADHGADVIKIERPQGEDARRIGPFVNGESLYFANYNRNKRAITLNLKSDEGRDLLHSLAAEADVVVENYRPDVLARLGLGYEELSAINPRLVVVSITGFGQTGPSRDLPAFDQIVQALSGVMYLGGTEGRGPEKMGISVSDYAAGLQGAIGALLALLARESSGQGQHVDISLFDSLTFMLETALATFVATGEKPPRVGNGRPGSVPGNAYECRDGWIYLAATSDRIWERLLAVVGEPVASELSDLVDNADRVRERERVDRVMAGWCAEKSVDETIQLLQQAGVPSAPVRNVDSLLHDPHVAARQSVEFMDHPGLGEHVVPGVPVKLSSTPGGLRRRASRLGEDNEAVLGEFLGFDASDVARLRSQGVM